MASYTRQIQFGNTLSTNLTLYLPKGQTYKIVFFADSGSPTYTTTSTTSETTISYTGGAPGTLVFDTNAAYFDMDYSGLVDTNVCVKYDSSVADQRDIFYQIITFDPTTDSGYDTHTVNLYRPQAQINVGTNDAVDPDDDSATQRDEVLDMMNKST